MTKGSLYIAWGVLFAICAGLGFVPNPSGAMYAVSLILALLFFVPPTILTCKAIKENDVPELKRLRTICFASLGATVIALMLNFLSVGFTATAGKLVYWLLILVSAPMVCGQIWLISLFLWGCLLSAVWQEIFKRRKK